MREASTYRAARRNRARSGFAQVLGRTRRKLGLTRRQMREWLELSREPGTPGRLAREYNALVSKT